MSVQWKPKTGRIFGIFHGIEAVKKPADFHFTECCRCIGKGDDKLEKVFKIDKFIEKISVDVQKNERGLYEDDLVFSALISSFESWEINISSG